MSSFKVKEVEVKNIPPPRGRKYAAFIADVTLRLEQTTEKKALQYEFDNTQLAQRHRNALKTFPKGTVESRVIPNGGSTYLYIWRGPHYEK